MCRAQSVLVNDKSKAFLSLKNSLECGPAVCGTFDIWSTGSEQENLEIFNCWPARKSGAIKIASAVSMSARREDRASLVCLQVPLGHFFEIRCVHRRSPAFTRSRKCSRRDHVTFDARFATRFIRTSRQPCRRLAASRAVSLMKLNSAPRTSRANRTQSRLCFMAPRAPWGSALHGDRRPVATCVPWRPVALQSTQARCVNL